MIDRKQNNNAAVELRRLSQKGSKLNGYTAIEAPRNHLTDRSTARRQLQRMRKSPKSSNDDRRDQAHMCCDYLIVGVQQVNALKLGHPLISRNGSLHLIVVPRLQSSPSSSLWHLQYTSLYQNNRIFTLKWEPRRVCADCLCDSIEECTFFIQLCSDLEKPADNTANTPSKLID
ncbi:unnamed protein product [Ceratitis capitata]|uniref:(Mediterranean fruit fly) hypothetical protein n=1 Tax=Ceratitis capitata TaxID=7213 RepID=A0A811V8I4_CERCA|nr:unnamed protein product [Ceratitis capitata]